MIRKRLALIGNGMATGRLLDELLTRDAAALYEIAVFGEESHGCYNRILLGRLLSGDEPDAITIKPAGWYEARGVAFHPGTRVARLDPGERRVVAVDGRTFPYDAVVIATGSAPVVPPLAGLHDADGSPKPGLFAFRTVEDCLRMRALVRPAAGAIVLGGGLLGLEAAAAFAARGLHVTVVHRAATLMNTQLDATAGAMLRRSIERLGIYLRLGQSAESVLGDDRVEGLRLESGEVLHADLLVMACGIRPRVEVAAASGVPVRRGVVVNDRLATAVPGVFAVGECAEHDARVYGLVQPIWDQCAVLADVLTGADPGARYTGSKVYARLKVAGVEVASMGMVEPERDTDEVVQVIEERRGAYRKLIVRDGRLVGAQAVGCPDAGAALVQLFDRGELLPPNRLDVLATSGAVGAAADPEVCNCHHVPRSRIAAAIAGGCTTLPALAESTRAGTGCGSCRGRLADLLLQHARTVTPPRRPPDRISGTRPRRVWTMSLDVPTTGATPDPADPDAPGPRRRVLWLATASFTLLFAVWLMLGMLGIPIGKELGLSKAQLYDLGIAAILAGSLPRFLFGVWADRRGGRPLLVGLLLFTAMPTLGVAFVRSYEGLLACALLYGLAGNAFSVGVSWVAAWYPRDAQGTALGVFGAGNVGASLTKLLGPVLIALMPPAACWAG